MFQKKIVDMLVDQVCAIIYGTMFAPVMNYVISRAIASLSTAAQLKLNPNGTVMEKLVEEGEKRYIHGVANDFVDKYYKGELQVDLHAKEKLDQLVERCQTEGRKPANMTEELALNVKGGKQGGVIELCVMAMLTKKPISVLQQQLNGEASEGDGSIMMVYTPPTIDKATGKTIDGHYKLAGGITAKGGSNDCLYTTILSKTEGQFSSTDDMRTQCAAFILTNPSFISGIHPALSIINQTRNPLRWKELMGEGGAKKANYVYPQEKRQKTVTNIQDTNAKIVKDMLDYVDSSELDGASTHARNWIKSIIETDLKKFHEQNLKEVVEIEYKLVVPTHGNGSDINLGFSVNVDEPDPNLKQGPHDGCKFYKKGKDQYVGHKFFSEKPTYHRTRTSRQPRQIEHEPI